MANSGRRALDPERREELRRKRHESRASSTYKVFIRTLCDGLSLPQDAAERAATSVLCALEQRLVGDEASHLEAQLPVKFKELLVRCERHTDLRPRDIGRAEFLQMVAADLGLPLEEAEKTVRGVFDVLAVHVSAGELDDVLSTLPSELRELWPRIQEDARRGRGARTPSAHRRDESHESVQEVVDHLLALPFPAQLGVLRTVAPRIVGQLSGEDRDGFLRDLNEEIAHMDRGEPAYDIRSAAASAGKAIH